MNVDIAEQIRKHENIKIKYIITVTKYAMNVDMNYVQQNEICTLQ